MKFLEYLYFKYYCFQVDVGNKNEASFTAMLIIAISLSLYYVNILILLTQFLSEEILTDGFVIYSPMISVILFSFYLYFLLVYNGKYKGVLKRNEKYKGRKRLGAVLFPLIAFLLMIIGFIWFYAKNNGLIS